MALDLSRLSPGLNAKSADIHQFGDLLLGIMVDQPVNLRHQLSVGGGAGGGAITPTQVPLTVLAVPAQTANLIEVKDSSGTVLAHLDPSGNMTIAGGLTLSAGNLTAAFGQFTNLNVSGSIASGGLVGAAVQSTTGQLGVAGDGGALASAQTFTSVRGVGNGAATAVTAPALGTGAGPANPLLVVDYVKCYDATGAIRWIALFA